LNLRSKTETKKANKELTDIQWATYWRIIEEREVLKTRAIILNAKDNAERKAYNDKYPLHYDEHGNSYGNLKDEWTGRMERVYENHEMGG